jgi:hypothetical protein
MVAPMTFQVDLRGMEEFAKLLKGSEKQINRNVATAINETKKKAVTFASRQLKTELPVPVRILKKTLETKSVARENKLYARMNMWGGYPISLRHFQAKMTKQGVTYRRSKSDKGRMISAGAFIIRKGGKVYRRAGKERGPLVEVFGPSPGDAIKVLALGPKVLGFIQEQLPLSVERRLRAIKLAQSGTIKLRKGMT